MEHIDDNQYVYIKKPETFGGVFHLVGEDNVSVCGRATVGEKGYAIVYRSKPVLRAVRCANCAMGRHAEKQDYG